MASLSKYNAVWGQGLAFHIKMGKIMLSYYIYIYSNYTLIFGGWPLAICTALNCLKNWSGG